MPKAIQPSRSNCFVKSNLFVTPSLIFLKVFLGQEQFWLSPLYTHWFTGTVTLLHCVTESLLHCFICTATMIHLAYYIEVIFNRSG